jgi:hypothetical protein
MAKTQIEKIKMISDIRARNNLLWMKLLALALESSPKKAKIILAAIRKNDRQVTKWLGKL